jgi:uncharacterized SAM-binding protein YcdF (DUF218 family)
MLDPIDPRDEEDFQRAVLPIWEYLARADPPVVSDVIFVFGSQDLTVPRHAAELYQAGYARSVLVTGRFGPMTANEFDKAEALVFKDELMRRQVPERVITTEVEAGNTLENVRFGMAALRAVGQRPRSALLVSKPFVTRRCLATFARQHPEVVARGCPPPGSAAARRDRTPDAFAARLVAELQRLDRYAARGDTTRQEIPPLVLDTASRLDARLGEGGSLRGFHATRTDPPTA